MENCQILIYTPFATVESTGYRIRRQHVPGMPMANDPGNFIGRIYGGSLIRIFYCSIV